MLQLVTQIKTSIAVIKQRWPVSPRVGIILGSGLNGLADEVSTEQVFDYREIPNFPRASALGHRGQLVCGKLAGVPVVAFEGRYHLYEGNTPQQAALPVRLARALGAPTLIISNAAGGLNPAYSVGDIMLIEDQINLMFANPLVGVNDDNLGPRFPDMSQPFDAELNDVASVVAQKNGFLLHRGVYVGMLGPNYETRAEYRMLRTLGGDAVGMSSVPEVLAARHAGMRVLGLSAISNVASPDSLTETSGHAVLTAAATAAGKLSQIIRGVVTHLGG